MVVLDLGLPDGDGKDVIRRVREWSDVPIIVLSAREREAEKIAAFDLGADDYVDKPFGVGELMARLRAALRHRLQRRDETPVLRLGELEIDNVRHRVTRAGAEIKLTPQGVRAALVPCAPCRQGRHPQADPDRRLGAGAHARTRNTCASISASCARRSRRARRSAGSSSRRSASATGLRNLFSSRPGRRPGAAALRDRPSPRGSPAPAPAARTACAGSETGSRRRPRRRCSRW